VLQLNVMQESATFHLPGWRLPSNHMPVERKREQQSRMQRITEAVLLANVDRETPPMVT
jgi:hypothetical protein